MHAWGFAAWTVALGVIAHALAGGPLPSGRLTLLLVTVVALLARALAEREVSLPALLLAAAAVQVGVHLALLDPGAGHSGPAPSMVACHLAAVALLACWLRCGEVALWSLLRLAAGRVRAVLTLLAAVPLGPVPLVRAPLVAAEPSWLAGPAALLPAHRGPPPRTR